MTSIPSIHTPGIAATPHVAPAAGIYFGSEEPTADRVEVKKKKEKKEKKDANSDIKKGPFIQGSIMGGIGRMLSMGLLRPIGWVETAIDITLMLPWSFGLFIPPPFATKHFLEGFIGANTLYSKDKRGLISTFPYVIGAHKDKYYAEGYGNRTVLGALWNHVFKVFSSKPTAFDIAKHAEKAAA